MGLNPDVGLAGYSQSTQKIITIGLGQTTHTEIADMGKNYAFIVLTCENLAGFPVGGDLTFKAAIFAPTPAHLAPVFPPGDPSGPLALGLLSAGGMYMAIEALSFARFFKLTLSAVATAEIVLTLTGFDGATGG